MLLFCRSLTKKMTPPFGINLFTAVSTTGESYDSVVKGVLSFMVVMWFVFLFVRSCRD
ncbi:TRAP transporter large permease subunit [Flintibacter sp. HCN-6482]|uniref:TRAP transporter large permease subunit n=1 Tax=Flintibacter sp. HCN-6482 TaxID=3134672 RepID=UPI00403FE4F4